MHPTKKWSKYIVVMSDQDEMTSHHIRIDILTAVCFCREHDIERVDWTNIFIITCHHFVQLQRVSFENLIHDRDLRPSSCVAEWSKHGLSGGGLCCFALLPEPLQLPCWACGPVEVQMGCLRCPMRWCVTTAMQGWVERACMRF